MQLTHAFLGAVSLFATWREVHGVRIATFAPKGISEKDCNARISEAIQLIARVHPRQVGYLNAHMNRVLCAPTGRDRAVVAAFIPMLRMCLLDPHYVARSAQRPLDIAATIVHEGMHARLHARGCHPRIANNSRVESICDREERRFVARAR